MSDLPSKLIVSFDGRFFVRASVHINFLFLIKSPVFLELGRLMSHNDSTALLLVSGNGEPILLNQIARPNASTLPSRKFTSPSKVAIINFRKLARPF